MSSPAAEPGEFLCLLFLSLCGRKKSKKKKNWTAALLELLVKSGRQGRDEPMGGGGGGGRRKRLKGFVFLNAEFSPFNASRAQREARKAPSTEPDLNRFIRAMFTLRHFFCGATLDGKTG